MGVGAGVLRPRWLERLGHHRHQAARSGLHGLSAAPPLPPLPGIVGEGCPHSNRGPCAVVPWWNRTVGVLRRGLHGGDGPARRGSQHAPIGAGRPAHPGTCPATPGIRPDHSWAPGSLVITVESQRRGRSPQEAGAVAGPGDGRDVLPAAPLPADDTWSGALSRCRRGRASAPARCRKTGERCRPRC